MVHTLLHARIDCQLFYEISIMSRVPYFMIDAMRPHVSISDQHVP